MRPGDVIYVREGGAKIILDRIEGEGLQQEIYAHVVDENGKVYEAKLLDNILSWGYWESVD